MLSICYLTSAALFYFWIGRNAPIIEEPALAEATQPSSCEVIELFPSQADQAARRAA